MQVGQRLWTREELIQVFYLYCRLPFGRMDQRNADVRALAGHLGRTPGAVAYKLVNFASLDPQLQQRGIKGASHASKLDREVWNDFHENWTTLIAETERLLAPSETYIPVFYGEENIREGRVREQIVQARVNQNFFRTAVMTAYNGRCCITGLQIGELLIAAHILPWSKNEQHRLNPRNGIALNALHDKAFEHGLITISAENCTVRISTELQRYRDSEVIRQQFLQYENRSIFLPEKFAPDRQFLQYHNDECFRG